MATADTAAAPSSKGNLIVTLAALTVLAVVGGGVVGKVLAGRIQAATPEAPPAAAPAKPYNNDLEIRELPAIVTNLADPGDTRVRLQVSIVFAKKSVEEPTILMAKINDDLVAFLKTVSLKDLEGASGLQNLREDLNDRAAARSDGKVREVIIETLVLQ